VGKSDWNQMKTAQSDVLISRAEICTLDTIEWTRWPTGDYHPPATIECHFVWQNLLKSNHSKSQPTTAVCHLVGRYTASVLKILTQQWSHACPMMGFFFQKADFLGLHGWSEVKQVWECSKIKIVFGNFFRSLKGFNLLLFYISYHHKTKGLIIWTLLSRRLVVATTTKPNLGHLASASEVAGGHTIPFKNWQTMPFSQNY
jgi:hypothetical protein